MKYCKECVYPEIAVNINFAEDGVCTSCKTFKKFKSLSEDHWSKREKRFEEIILDIKKRNKSDYDCIIPVSGGKDSYYQTHIIVEKYGLKPLLVTYHGNNFLPEGDYNRDRMRHVFNADHLVWGPSIDVLKKLNRLAFFKMGDMNWQNHCGIFTAPIQIACKFNIPLIVWGEIAWDISGMYEPNDFVEFSARVRHEHGLRGYEWYDFLEDDKSLSEKDMQWAKYPTDKEIVKSNVKGIYIGNFFRWDPNKHVKLMMSKYNWQPSKKPFQRTYRNFSNLDDRYENGAHDLLKFIKFGYGRASDHASKDIRDGYMDRQKGIEMVLKYDHVVSDDLNYWLKYIDLKEEDFWRTADKFRDKNIWKIKKKKWHKIDIDGIEREYGEVNLTSKEINEYDS